MKYLENEQRYFKTILFDKKGNMIKGDFSIDDISDLCNLKENCATVAAFSTIKDKSSTGYSSLKEINSDEIRDRFLSDDELPSMILVLPK
jgi:hypothetical protein